MKAIKQTIRRLMAGCVIACCLTSNSSGQTTSSSTTQLTPEQIEERRAIAKAKTEEMRRVLQAATERAMLENAERQKTNPPPSASQLAALEAAAETARQARFQENFAPFLATDLRGSDGAAITQTEWTGEQSQRLLISAQAAEQQFYSSRSNALVIVDAAGFSPVVENEDGSSGFLYGTDVGGPVYVKSFNSVSADTISTDEARPGGSTGLGLTGTNQAIGLWDVGDVRLTHQEFTSGGARVFDLDGVSPYGVSFHSTHVTGTLAAKGVVSASKGMAYEARVNAFDLDLEFSEMQTQAATNNLRVSNHSYGIYAGWGGFNSGYPIWWGDLSLSTTEDWQFGFYNYLSQSVDSTAYAAPNYLSVWAAGNDRGEIVSGAQPLWHWAAYLGTFYLYNNVSHPADGGITGYDTISGRQVSKNGLAVGAVNDISGGYAGSGSVVMSSFSCFGPTDDGRIKPDLVANGIGLYSTYDTSDSAYSSLNGTSMAAPSVTGSLALLYQLHDQLHGTNQPWLASTWKALLIQTSDEAGAANGPDYQFGWGLMNEKTSALLVKSNATFGGVAYIKETVLPNTNSIEFNVTATGTNQLKITTVWTDPPATVLAFASLDPTNRMLINDLDLRVVRSGVTNFPWILNPTSPANAATSGDNVRDNVEQVIVSSPVSNGVYTVRITHKGTLTDGSNNVTNQRVSIIVSGIKPQAEPALRITDMMVLGGWAVLKWDSEVGRFYRVEARDSLTTGSWSAITGEIATIKAQTSISVALTGVSQRFYRIAQVR